MKLPHPAADHRRLEITISGLGILLAMAAAAALLALLQHI